jgi:ubiquinone/menaquinone biosynthesis C-methylase UbiE
MKKQNIDKTVVSGFGDEWERFDQSDLTIIEHTELFERYFSIFPWELLSNTSVGFDMGCGSGRWAKLVAPRVGMLHCVDPSSAITVAIKNLSQFSNCTFHSSSVDEFSVASNSMDFGYSLGVLHHIPNTQSALNDCVDKLKSGAPFLLYLYYAFDNKPIWFRLLFKISNLIRLVVSRLPHKIRYFVSQVIAIFIYFPISRFSFLLEKLGLNVDKLPLSAYRNSSFYTMRTDSLDRFGTKLEQRFTKVEIENMMRAAGLKDIKFSSSVPFWCAVGIKK